MKWKEKQYKLYKIRNYIKLGNSDDIHLALFENYIF